MKLPGIGPGDRPAMPQASAATASGSAPHQGLAPLPSRSGETSQQSAMHGSKRPAWLALPDDADSVPRSQAHGPGGADPRADNRSLARKLGYWTGACKEDFTPLLDAWNAMHSREKPWTGPRFLAWLSDHCSRLRDAGNFCRADESGSIEEYTVMLESRDGSAKRGPYTIWRIASKSGRYNLRIAPPRDKAREREEVQLHMRHSADVCSTITRKGQTGLAPWTQAYSSSRRSYNEWAKRGKEFRDLLNAWNAGINQPISGAQFMQRISALCDAKLCEGRYLAIDDIDSGGMHFMRQPSAMSNAAHRNGGRLAIRKFGAIIECVLTLDDPSRELSVGPFAVWQMVTTSGDVFLRRPPAMPPGFENLRLQIPPGFENMQLGDLQKRARFGHLHPISFLHALVDEGLLHLLGQPLAPGEPGLPSRTLTGAETAALIDLRNKRNALRERLQRTAYISNNCKPGTEAGPSEPVVKRRRA